MMYDVAIIGGGPAGLSAALALGRARKRVLLLDAGPRRNAAATHIHNFVTRDGTPPDEFRRVARGQLATYPNVELRDARVAAIAGEKGAFALSLEASDAAPVARRIILCNGMMDERLPIEGFDELWGHSIFQCPYCHGWEAQDQAWGVIARDAMTDKFAIMLRGWTKRVTLFMGVPGSEFAPSPEVLAQLQAAGIVIERAPVVRLRRDGQAITAVELEGGKLVSCEAMFVHPPQRQVALVASLGLALDEHGFVKVDPMKRETSTPGMYAAGDLTTRGQAAILGAAAAMQTAAALNFELTAELVATQQV